MSLENIIEALGAKPSSNGKYRSKCPAHGGKKESLIFSERDDKSVHIHCFAGCTADEVLGAVGLSPREAWKPLEKLGDAGYVRKMERISRVCAATRREMYYMTKLDEEFRSGKIDELNMFNRLLRLCPTIFNESKRIDSTTRELVKSSRLQWNTLALLSITSTTMLSILFEHSLVQEIKN